MAFENDEFGEVREKWRRHILMCVASDDNFLHDVEGKEFPNTPENRMLFGLVPDAHRRHDIEYTIDDIGRHISKATMLLSPAAFDLLEDIRVDIEASLNEAAERAGQRYSDVLPSTMGVVQDRATALCEHFGDDAKEAIEKINALMKEIEDNERKLAEEGKSFDQVGGKSGDNDD